MTDTFPEKFVTGVINHINDDHRAEMLDLARGLAGCNWAEEAEILHADPRGINLLLRTAGHEERLRVPFDPPLAQPNQFRPALITLIGQARARLGLPNVVADAEPGRSSTPTNEST